MRRKPDVVPTRLRRLARLGAGAFIALLLPAAVALGDIVILTDGTRLEGTIRRTADGYSVTAADGTVTHVKADQVSSIQIGGGGDNGGSGAGTRPDVRLESLRRSVANLDDLSLIISKYQSFIQQNAGSAAGEEAKWELEKWLDYRDRGLVKYGREWLTPEDRDARLQEAFVAINGIRLQIKQGELTAARESLGDMLDRNPEDMSALYLMGVLELREGQIGRARGTFERVRAAESGHAPTLVNLAVIAIQQNQHQRALTFLAEAMNREPENRQVLDNVAEALELVPADDRDSRQAEQVQQTFLSQDAALRQRMGERGLYRWGSTWVGREQLEQLQALEKEIEARIAELAEDYGELQEDVRIIERDYQANEVYMQRLAASSVYRDEEGRLRQAPLPPAYYEAQRDQQILIAERENKLRQMAQLEAQQAQERARFPTPPFKGHLEPIGEDGVPVHLPAGAATPGVAGDPQDPTTRPGDPTTRPGA